MKTLAENATYRLELEHLKTERGMEGWISLVHKATGECQIITAKLKAQAEAIFHGMTLDEVGACMDRMGCKRHKVYKAAGVA